MTAFTPDAAQALPGPVWLRARRLEAAERFAASSLPSPEEEVWRYSRVAELDLDAFRLAVGGGDGVPDAARDVLDPGVGRAATVVVAEGRIVLAEVAPQWAARGLRAGALTEDDRDQRLLAGVEVGTDVFALMNDAFAADPVVVDVPSGLAVTDPILVVSVAEGEAAATFPRLSVRIGAGGAATVLDVHRTGAALPGNLVIPVATLDVGEGASLGVATVQDLSLSTWHIGSQVSSVDAEASFTSGTAALGGDYARQRTDCRLAGRGASGTLLAAYFGEGDQTLDFRTFQDHAAPDTTSNLLFKGAVAGRSRSVYTGLIRVRKNARGTNAFQTNRNIKLSEHAWAESVPNLEIENNDVRCSHASAVGPIDEEQRFYLESRGIPPAIAERLVVSGFFDEVITQLPVAAAVAPLQEAIAGKLDRSSS